MTGPVSEANTGICVMMWAKELAIEVEEPRACLEAAVREGHMKMLTLPHIWPQYRSLIAREILAGQVNAASFCFSQPARAEQSSQGELHTQSACL